MSKRIVFLAVWIVVSIALWIFFLRAYPSDWPILNVFLSILFGGLVAVAVHQVTTVEIPAKTMLVSKDYRIAEVFEKKTILWRWNDFLRWTKLVSFSSRSLGVSMETFIFANTGVRHLCYEVKIETPGTPESTSFLLRSFKDWTVLRERIQSDLYEFQESYKIDLIRFYNPLDDSQQKMFSELVLGFLDKHFVKGEDHPIPLVLVGAHFSL